ncbi:hypothetical protein GGS21DRAFT_491037 [Xylaria nigripes]|nr:hypothetical protein GGS21DRAFT_491037 [Xylaria nigripes]
MGMVSRRSFSACIWALLMSLLVHNHVTLALSWRGRTSVQSMRSETPILEDGNSASQLLRVAVERQSSYEIALNELQELESEPLCHRIAARLLVNNCQLLEGKDEATVLTDSGRKIRDFVDSYAASLAICDLERGRFVIPRECSKFQETTLSQLPIQNGAHLHVTSAEIDGCLSGLGASDSAWNTWVSYRHKALRFCEVARADNEKAQNILLFRRLTKIMSKLADDAGAEIEQRMNSVSQRAQVASDKIDGLSPLLDKLQHNIETAVVTVTNRLFRGITDSQTRVDSGLKNALQLDTLLQLMVKNMTESHAEMAVVQEQSLQAVSQRASSEVDFVLGAMAAVVDTTTTAIQTRLETTLFRFDALESRQDNLEQGLQRLTQTSNSLTDQFDVQMDLLKGAQNITKDIYKSLADAAASAATVGNLFLENSLTSWWPYIWCPMVSLVMGSYGLPPSLLRNLGLVALGETAGIIISSPPSSFFGVIRESTADFLGSFIRPSFLSDDSHNSTNLTSQLE